MKYDDYGRLVASTKDICRLLYENPELDYSKFLVEDTHEYNSAISYFRYDSYPLVSYSNPNGDDTLEEFDQKNQKVWHMPAEYREFDIADWAMAQCRNEQEINRVQLELKLYEERNMLPLLQYIKFLVDLMEKHNIVWGVGRGSSTASYILFLLGLHQIDSLKYELDIEEFLK